MYHLAKKCFWEGKQEWRVLQIEGTYFASYYLVGDASPIQCFFFAMNQFAWLVRKKS
jgi:hypothetical protein